MSKERKVEIVKGIISLLLFNYYSLFKYFPLLFFNLTKKDFINNPKANVYLILFTSCILLIILLLMYKKDLINEFKEFMKNTSQKLDIGISCWAVGLIIMIASNLFLNYVLHSGGAKNETAVQSYISAFPLIMGIDVCIIAPIYEEIVFRKAIKDIVKKPILFVIASFLIFGIVHVITQATNWIDWLYIIPYGALGGAFAYAYSKTDTIYTSIFLHMAHNTMIFLLSIFTL